MDTSPDHITPARACACGVISSFTSGMVYLVSACVYPRLTPYGLNKIVQAQIGSTSYLLVRMEFKVHLCMSVLVMEYFLPPKC